MDIESAFAHLVKHGLPSSGDPCHSPMAFLGKAMEPVLEEASRIASIESEKAAVKAEKVRREKANDEKVIAIIILF